MRTSQLATLTIVVAALAMSGCQSEKITTGSRRLVPPDRPLASYTNSSCSAFASFSVGGGYKVQNNAYNLQNGGQQCIYIDANGTDWKETSTNSVPTNGAPGGYPSIYAGCHWGNCSSNQHGLPIQESAIGSAPSAWSVTPSTNGNWDIAYDIWFNSTPTTGGQPDGLELMIWTKKMGTIQPAGSKIRSAVSIDGMTWDVWQGNSGKTVSYVATSGVNSVNFDLVNFFHDAVSHGYVSSSYYLIDVEAGTEIWTPGSNFATSSFSVDVSTGGGGGGGGSGNTHSGTWSLKGTLPSTQNYSNVSQAPSVASNATYVASVWIKGPGSVQLYVKNGNWGSTTLASVQCTNSGSTWVQCSTPSFSTGSNTQVTYILQDTYAGAATVYLDDCFLGVSGGTNKLANPGFESGTASWGNSNTSTWHIGQW